MIDFSIFVQNPKVEFDLIDIKIARVMHQDTKEKGTLLKFVIVGLSIFIVFLDNNQNETS